MVEVSLSCVIVGAAGSVFDVKIDDGKVSQLKKAITTENPKAIKVEAHKLQLFLAKKGKAWLNWPGAAAVTLNGKGYPQGFEEMDPTLFIKNPNNFGANFQPGEGEVHVLVVVPKDYPMPGDKRKREDPPDYWIQAIGETEVEVLPSSKGLKRVFGTRASCEDPSWCQTISNRDGEKLNREVIQRFPQNI
ncbi:hypothetical protein PF008_g16456 [Phytophthora fragariae]|uniref:Crinkler effector protein N-terminal domain-containing protein n=1 Tax=Phytophthora fragariae TaxID=53985 RepID=A0A6G0RB70_9STRA|nr:hypothetical protein PF008_g16456 [Phytophthora fragariae]